MPLSLEERRLAEELAYDEAVLSLVKPHTVGEFHKYDTAFVHPDSPYGEQVSHWLIAKATETLRADNYLSEP